MGCVHCFPGSCLQRSLWSDHTLVAQIKGVLSSIYHSKFGQIHFSIEASVTHYICLWILHQCKTDSFFVFITWTHKDCIACLRSLRALSHYSKGSDLNYGRGRTKKLGEIYPIERTRNFVTPPISRGRNFVIPPIQGTLYVML